MSKGDRDRNRKQGNGASGKGPNEFAECWKLYEDVVWFADRILLHGPCGTGKSRQALTCGLRDGQRAYHLTLTEETPAAEIRGMWVPGPYGFQWQDGPAISAWRTGGRLVLDEIDHASGDIMSLLMAIIDGQDTACITLPNNETVEPAPGFSIVATMNGDPDQLPPALRDRFTVTIEIDAVHPDALAALPSNIRNAANATALLPPERRLSIRAWAQFAHLRQYVSEGTAAAAVFGRARANDVLDALRLALADQSQAPQL
jgi:MoxR-like ATPase